MELTLDWNSDAFVGAQAPWRAQRRDVRPSVPLESTAEQPAIDPALLRQVAEGNIGAFERIYGLMVGPVFSLALRMLDNPDDAEDLTQEVFVKIWKDAATYDPSRGAPLAWAFTMTRHKAIDRLRSRGRQARLRAEATDHAETAPPPQPPNPGRAAVANETASAVRNALDELEPDVRRTIELAYFSGLSQTEVSSTLGQPLSTTKSHTRRALARLRGLLGRMR